MRQMPIRGVFSNSALPIISAFSWLKERDLGEGVKARRHTVQYKRSLPCWVRP